MKRFLLLLGIWSGLLAQSLSAQTSLPARPENRFLFIVDTSSGMSRHNDAVRQVVYDLISTGMNGQMRPGDSFALWTYNQQNYPGIFPLQNWNPYERALTGGRAAYFLKQQRYEKNARPEAVIPDLATVIDSARDLTVYWISDGNTELKGTPFDDLINAACFYKIRAMKREQRPLVITLFAQDGKLVSWAVNISTQPEAIPHNPPKPVIAAKPVPTEKLKEPSATPVIPDPKPTAASPPTKVPEKSVAVPKPAPVTSPAKPTVAEIIPATPKSVVPEVRPVVTLEISKPTPPVAAPAPVSLVGELPPAQVKPPLLMTETSRAKSEPAKPPTPAAGQAAKAKLPTVPGPAVTSKLLDEKAPRLRGPAQTAVVAPPHTGFKSGFYLAAGLLFLAIAGCLFYLHRQARAAMQPSIISASLKRRRK